MKKLYEELMGRVEVTDEMKTRILSRIQAESLQMVPSPKAKPFWNYKRFASLAACFAILAVGVWSAINIKAPVAETPPGFGVQAVPNMAEAASVEELAELVGFQVDDIQGLPFEPTEAIYTAWWGEMAEIRYRSGEAEAVFRKSTGTEDISGDFNSYDTVQTLAVGGIAVTLKGNSGSYLSAIWTRNGFSYSLSISCGAPEEVWVRIIAETA